MDELPTKYNVSIKLQDILRSCNFIGILGHAFVGTFNDKYNKNKQF